MVKMKTIAIFSGYYLPHLGGVERYTYNLAKKFKEKGYNVVIITSRFDKCLKEIEKTEYAKIYRLSTFKIFSQRYPIIKKCNKILKLLQNENIDSIILQTRFWLTSYIGAKFAKKNNIPVCLIEHGSSHFTVNNKVLDFFGEKYEHWLTNQLKKNVKDFFGVSYRCTEWLKHFNINAKGVFYNSVDTDEIQEYKNYINKDNNKIVISYTGRMIEEKGVFKLIQAFKCLNKKYKNIELNLAGDGPILEKIIKENKDIDNIHILGRLSHENIMKLLGKTSIFVNPSAYSEGLPTTILEAGMMECAVVATPMGGTAEIISDENIGYICGFDVDEIQKKIEKLIQNPEEIKRLSKNISEKIKSDFSWDVTTNKIINTINYKL